MFPLTLHVFYNERKTCALVICIHFVNKKSVILRKIKVSISGPSTSRYVKIFLKSQAVRKCEGEKKTPLKATVILTKYLNFSPPCCPHYQNNFFILVAMTHSLTQKPHFDTCIKGCGWVTVSWSSSPPLRLHCFSPLFSLSVCVLAPLCVSVFTCLIGSSWII